MATKEEVVRNLLNSHFIFRQLPEQYRRGLEDAFDTERFNAGDLIAEMHKPISGMYFVYSGKVRFKGMNEVGKRVSLGEQPEGSTFGEISLISDANWDHQVVASTDVILLKMPVQKIRQLVQGDRELGKLLSKQIGVIELRKRLSGILGEGTYTPEVAAEILNNIGAKRIPRGTNVFQQGDHDPRLYFIEHGSVELVQDLLEGTVVLEKVTSGGLIGEEAALKGQKQAYTAKAVTDVTVLVLRQPEVQKIIETNFQLRDQLETRIKKLKERSENQAKSAKRSEGADQRVKLSAISEADFKKSDIFKTSDKFKTVMQQDETENAAACLTMIMRIFGKEFTLGQIQEWTHLHIAETPLTQVCTAAETLGFRAKPYKSKYEELKLQPLPCIILWEHYHYMVLHKISGDKVYLADPEKGQLVMSRAEFEVGWDEVLILLEPTMKFNEVEPPANPIFYFAGFLLPFKFYFGEAFLSAVAINILGLASPLFVQNIVDGVVVNKDVQLLNIMLVGMVLVTFFNLALSSTQQMLLAHTIARIDMKMMSEFCRHTLSLPMTFFGNRQVGDILARFGENQKIRGILAGSTITVVLNAMMIVVYLAMMFVYSQQLTITVLFFIPMYIANTLIFTPRLKAIANEIFHTYANQQSSLIEALQGIESIKATANEYYARSRWEDAFTDNVNLGYKSTKLSLVYGNIAELINLGSTVTILWLGASLVIADEMTIGSLMGFNILMGSVMGPIMAMVNLWDNLQEIRIAMDRVNDINNVKPEQPPVTSPENLPVVLKHCEGRVEFRNIKFRYGGEESPLILNEFNLTIEPGQTVAFVGPSGCGKSTAMKMIIGFLSPTEGEVLIDGTDISSLDLGAYRRHIGIVLQDSFLFGDTVAGNIALGDPDPDMNAVREASRLASADDFIVRLGQGYHTMLGAKGISVSGGQRQRMCIARALYHRPKIILFDEATSALDNESEARIQENMKSILSGRTAVVIAHRLSTIRDADYICFMDGGKVQEKGSHDELVASKGRYYEMAKKQFDLE